MNGVPPRPACQSQCRVDSTSPSLMPVSASVANSSRLRTGPGHWPDAGIPPRALVHDGLDLAGSKQRHRPGCRAAQPYRCAAAGPAPAADAPARERRPAAPAQPVEPPGHRNLMNIGLIAIERQHGGDPRRDRRFRRAVGVLTDRQPRHPGRIPGPQRGQERDERRQAHLVPGHPRRSQVLPPAGQRRRIRTDRVRRGLLGHPQELQVLLDRADRKMILPGDRPGPLPVEHDTLHPHARRSCRRHRRWCGTLDNDTPTCENSCSGHVG